ncbi:MAG: hypothetical protein RIM23_29380 [Coleofasciculus sp. G3-WIS-01]|uniref:hypothetical protein n=1 Tax=Coleofasciculus sp. G3-WIS-01 TaxID=3069528 RepID=UPI0032FBAAF1
MSQRLETTLALPQITLKIHSGTDLVLQLLLRNHLDEAVLFRPTLDDWVLNDGNILPIVSRLEPTYVYLFPEYELTCQLTVPIPEYLPTGTSLTTWLRFPGWREDAIPIQVEILETTENSNSTPVIHPLMVTFPPPRDSKENYLGTAEPTTAGIFGLMSGLIDLDKIPARWLIAELLTRLCQHGTNYAQTPQGNELLTQLSRTQFFKNGVYAFSSAQVPAWISSSLSMANTLLAAQIGQRHLLSVWEEWLWDLAETDIEIGDGGDREVNSELNKGGFCSNVTINSDKKVPKPAPTNPVPYQRSEGSILNTQNAEEWLAGLILGLAQVSPRIEDSLRAIATHESIPIVDHTIAAQASYSLTTGLPGLDALPGRWLVVELLILLAQQGDTYSRTESGCQLLNQLSRTRFFKNGVLAFASAQAPRWLVISQSAAAAYHSSVGVQMGQGGLLHVGEKWLWTLVSNPLNLKGMDNPVSVSNAATKAFVTELGMDAQRWFVGILFGLIQVSPKMARYVKAIANLAPPPLTPTPVSPVVFDDVLNEGGSLGR